MTDWFIRYSAAFEAMSYLATALGIVIAILAGLFVLWKHLQDRKDQRWHQAHELYAQYLFDAKDHPDFFLDFWNQSKISAEDRWRYQLFISFMMWAIEDIAMIEKRSEWLKTLVHDLVPHHTYLDSPEFADELQGYFPAVRNLVAQAISESSAAHA